eukprot:1333515-Pyramimonas_sp.AAC.1
MEARRGGDARGGGTHQAVRSAGPLHHDPVERLPHGGGKSHRNHVHTQRHPCAQVLTCSAAPHTAQRTIIKGAVSPLRGTMSTIKGAISPLR